MIIHYMVGRCYGVKLKHLAYANISIFMIFDCPNPAVLFVSNRIASS